MSQSTFHLALAALSIILASCATSLRDAGGKSNEATGDLFAENRATKGVVLMDVNWGRRWNCGGFENAELRGIAFDKLPPAKASNDTPADVALVQPPNLASRPVFDSYALLLEPGEYALSAFSIKVARSVSDVSYWVANRSDLLKDGFERYV